MDLSSCRKAELREIQIDGHFVACTLRPHSGSEVVRQAGTAMTGHSGSGGDTSGRHLGSGDGHRQDPVTLTNRVVLRRSSRRKR